MGIFLAVIALFVLSLLLSTVFRKKIEETLPVSMFLVIILIYAAGLTGHLNVGVYLVSILAVAAVVCLIVKLIRSRENLLRSIRTPGLAIFLLLFVFSLFLQHGRVLVGWDEMSHWGLAAKNMFLLNNFGTGPDSNLIFKDYPPAAAVFEYFCLKLNGGYSDSIVMMSYNLLAFSPLLIVFREVEWKQWKQIIIRLLVILALPLAFYCDYRISVADFYTTIYVDPLLGILFGYMLYSWFSDKKDGFYTLKLCCTLFVMTLLKASGFGLALILLIIAALYQAMLYIRRRANHAVPAVAKKQVLQFIFMAVSVFAAEYSWKLVMASNHITKKFQTGNITLLTVINVLSGKGEPYTREVIRRFLTALFTKPLIHIGMVLPVGTVLLTAAMAGLMILLVRTEKDQTVKYRLKVTGAALIVFEFLYALSLLILYLFSFSQGEALALASFERYMNTYFLGISIFLAFRLVQAKHSAVNRKRAMIALAVGIMLMTNPISFLKDSVAALAGNRHSVQKMAPYCHMALKLEQYARQDGIAKPGIYFLDSSSAEYDYLAAKYYVTPESINAFGTWSEDSLRIQDLSSRFTPEYQYVYLFSVNDSFRNNFSQMFQGGKSSIQSGALYRVSRKNNMVKLIACK
ncbi:MAG TPA: hypothetical protein VHR42_03440 [Clostridia bacterium]|nr:hypothetical protein [Clostridia bacterium]